jgi:AcrR family transcriptional regulator
MIRQGSASMRRGKIVPIERPSDGDQDVRELLIQSAVKLFDKYGYSNVKISDITNNVDLTTGAFYYYFEGKHQILEEVANFYIQIAAIRAKEIYENSEMSCREKLIALLKNHCIGIANYHSHVSVFYREIRNLSAEGLSTAVENNRSLLFHTSDLIRQGAEQGIFRRDLHPKVTALAIIGMCNWLYQWFTPAGDLTIDEISDLFESLILDGLNAEPSPR